jgi:hypothetical protein
LCDHREHIDFVFKSFQKLVGTRTDLSEGHMS